MKHLSILTVCAVIMILVQIAKRATAGTKNKPHSHNGKLEPYDGKHIAYNINKEQNEKLKAGQPITMNERSGKSGRGVAIQDVKAPPEICMNRITDLLNYPKMVPKVRKIDIYTSKHYENGTISTGAEFEVGIFPLTFGYYLSLVYEPKYHTYSWTLDYQHTSDFDDNTGHWQVLPHPTKSGWTRVLYSSEVQLMPWIPEFVITFLTKTALLESTAWVRKESEKLAANAAEASKIAPLEFPDLSACFIEKDDGGAEYVTSCMNTPENNNNDMAIDDTSNDHSMDDDDGTAAVNEVEVEEMVEEDNSSGGSRGTVTKEL